MKILSITTSSTNCSVAICENNNIIKELNINDAKTHSETLMPLVKKILEETNLDLSLIDYLACDIGPGSFTGIRIGVSTVKAISEIKNIPICPVSSLEGLSYIPEISKKLIVSLIDARNDQAYCGIFNSDHSINTDFFADSITNIINVLKVQQMPIIFVGDGAILHRTLLESNFSNSEFETKSTISASCIAKAAQKKISQNQICNADKLLPLYLRKSQAERMKYLKNAQN